MKEIDLFGIYVSPMAVWLLLAAAIFFPLRWGCDRIELQRWVWHRRLFDTALFVIILSLVGLYLKL